MSGPWQPLRKAQADPDPLRQFHTWFEQAGAAGTLMPEAAAVATAAQDGAPSVRMVLVKQADTRGFVFYSNYESRKAAELEANPRAALLFYWEVLGRQVRIEGPVTRTTIEESAAYVRSRPRPSQLSALASPQSHPVESRDALEHLVAAVTAEYEGQDPPLPGNWGGFRLTPRVFEFWQHRDDRLHDRLRYTPLADGSWTIDRLAP